MGKNKNNEDQLWRKCGKCEQIIYEKELKENLWICPKCKYYFRLSSKERIEMLSDEDSFKEFSAEIRPVNPLNFPGYDEKIKKSKRTNDSVVTGFARLGGINIVLAVMEFEFMGGSMGSVVGEKITLAIETAIEKKLPLVIVSCSGGARMQEGILSLMQMAKTSAALSCLHNANIPYISVLTDPTTGGVSASYAMLGDINIAEEGALIGFAGPRVIEQTINQQLPDGFQSARFILEHGMTDMVVQRKDLKASISKILSILCASK